MAVGRDIQCPTEFKYARVVDWGAWPGLPRATRLVGLAGSLRVRRRDVYGWRRGIGRIRHEGRSSTDGTGVEGNACQCCREVGEYYRHLMCPKFGPKLGPKNSWEYPTRGIAYVGACGVDKRSALPWDTSQTVANCKVNDNAALAIVDSGSYKTIMDVGMAKMLGLPTRSAVGGDCGTYSVPGTG